MFLSAPFGFGGAGVNVTGLPVDVSGAFTDFSPPYGESYVRVTVKSNGEVSISKTSQSGPQVLVYAWHPTTDGIGVNYWLRITHIGGTHPPNLGVPPGATLRQLSADVMIGLTNGGATNGLRNTLLRFEWFSNAAGSGGAVATWNVELGVETAT